MYSSLNFLCKVHNFKAALRALDKGTTSRARMIVHRVVRITSGATLGMTRGSIVAPKVGFIMQMVIEYDDGQHLHCSYNRKRFCICLALLQLEKDHGK